MQHLLRIEKRIALKIDVENSNFLWAYSLSIKCTKYILALNFMKFASFIEKLFNFM